MRFLLFGLSNRGFVYPLIGLAKRLLARGHTVAFLTDESLAAFVESEGIERLTVGRPRKGEYDFARWSDHLVISRQVKKLVKANEGFGADVFVTHYLAHAPLYAAEICGVRLGILGLAAYLWPVRGSDSGRLSRGEVGNRTWQFESQLKMYQMGRKFLRLGQREWPASEPPILGDLFLVQSVPEFEACVDGLPSTVKCVGSCLWEPVGKAPNQEHHSWIDRERARGRQVVYAQPGRSFDGPSFWPQFVEACADSSVSIVASTSRADDFDSSVPEHCYVQEYVPQMSTLPYVDAVVSNGHTTSVLGAIENALPLLLFPNGSGTHEISARCVDAGIGVRLQAEGLTAASVREGLREILSKEETRERANSISASFSECNPDLAIQQLEGLVDVHAADTSVLQAVE